MPDALTPDQIIGYVAAVCTTLAFLPQVIKTWRSRSADDISLVMFVVFCTGVALWLVYGLLHRDLPLIAANVVTLALAGTILVLKIRSLWRPRSSQDPDMQSGRVAESAKND